MGCKRKERVKDNSKAFGLSNQKKGIFTDCNEAKRRIDTGSKNSVLKRLNLRLGCRVGMWTYESGVRRGKSIGELNLGVTSIQTKFNES